MRSEVVGVQCRLHAVHMPVLARHILFPAKAHWACVIVRLTGIFKKKVFLKIKNITRCYILGGLVVSGSIKSEYGSEDPDLYNNLTDPEHCFSDPDLV